MDQKKEKKKEKKRKKKNKLNVLKSDSVSAFGKHLHVVYKVVIFVLTCRCIKHMA